MSEYRRLADVEYLDEFPWKSKTAPFIDLTTGRWANDVAGKLAIIDTSKRIAVVWPGQYRTDLFLLEDDDIWTALEGLDPLT